MSSPERKYVRISCTSGVKLSSSTPWPGDAVENAELVSHSAVAVTVLPPSLLGAAHEKRERVARARAPAPSTTPVGALGSVPELAVAPSASADGPAP